ncbi:TPA: hypothetical protein RQN23_002878 [Aeromonas veronii]|nr:hypothetical protein [Aeromonas veronii]
MQSTENVEKGKPGLVKRVLVSTFRPSFPFAPPGSTPFTDVNQLSKFNRETKDLRKSHLNQQMEQLEQIEDIIDKQSLDDHEVYLIWCEVLGVDQTRLDNTLTKRYVLFALLVVIGFIMFGYSVGVIRGLYEGVSFSLIPSKIFGFIFIAVSINFIANAIKIYFHIWCIRNQMLPNIFQWLKRGDFLR